MSHSIGQTLVHHVHGLGVVESVEERHIDGHTTSFAVMNFRRMTVMVNQERTTGVLRSPISTTEAEKVLEYLGQPLDRPAAIGNPGVLHRGYVQSLRSGDPFQVCDIVRTLAVRAREKKLAPRELGVMQEARALLVTELAHVRQEAEDGMERTIDERLALA